MREIITTCVSYLGHMCAPSYPGNEQLSSLDFKKLVDIRKMCVDRER